MADKAMEVAGGPQEGLNAEGRRISQKASRASLRSLHQSFTQGNNPALKAPEVDEETPEEKKAKLWRHDLLNLTMQPMMVITIFYNMSFTNGDWRNFWWRDDNVGFWILWGITIAYFTIDTLWMYLVPGIVKSPIAIYAHHIVSMLYSLLPVFIPGVRWLFGACLIVEGNTWLLMVRRYHNPQKFVPFAEGTPLFTSLRLKLVEVLFYTTWIGIRMIAYPFMMVLLILEYRDYSELLGTYFNALIIALIFHPLFIYLNFVWSYDLFCPKSKGDVAEEDHDL